MPLSLDAPKRHRTPRPAGAASRRALSLVELLMVLAVMGVLAGLALATHHGGRVAQLEAAAQTVAADLAYARNLAVNNNSSYRVRFEPKLNRHVLEHAGADASLHALPPSPFTAPGGSATAHVFDWTRLPQAGGTITLDGAWRVASQRQAVAEIVFEPLGNLSSAEPVEIVLSCGGNDGVIVTLALDPVTGLVSTQTRRKSTTF